MHLNQCHPGIKDVELSQKLTNEGMRLDDHLRLRAIYGRNRNIQLKRTRYLILSENDFLPEDTTPQILIPTMKDEEFKLELSLYFPEVLSQNEKWGRYILKSLNNVPFYLNHQLVFSAYVQHGDILQLGLNKIDFLSGSESEEVFKSHQVLENDRIIKSNIPILLEGETGTGKSYLAKQIHQQSLASGKFIHINLSAFATNLIESELFGHEKGSFTGADFEKVGAFQSAEKGTLFLDEVDSLSWDIQTKLLLFLDSNKIRPVGSNIEKEIRTRLIFASGRPLRQLVEAGKMRKDFYFRIKSGTEIKLPPLRDNPEKIVNLIQEISRLKNVLVSYKLVEFYKTLPWPGNIRELRSHLEKKCILSNSNRLDFDQEDEALLTQSFEIDTFKHPRKIKSLSEIRYEHCYMIFVQLNQNLRQSAEVLRINVKTLRRILEEGLV